MNLVLDFVTPSSSIWKKKKTKIIQMTYLLALQYQNFLYKIWLIIGHYLSMLGIYPAEPRIWIKNYP